MTNCDITSDELLQLVANCTKDYGLQTNPALDAEMLAQVDVPRSSSKKLAFIIAAYKREATVDTLKGISDQPAGIVRALRNDGFEFKHDGRTPPNFQYKNDKGVVCREIVGFTPGKRPLSGRARELVDKSISAAVSAIEVYNKPNFEYREETFAILMVNAWELLLKGRLVYNEGGKISAIRVYDDKGKPKRNRSGNLLTIDLNEAAKRLLQQGDLDERCMANLGLVTEIRDNAVHFVNKTPNFNRRIQEVGTANLRNYVSAISDWFSLDLSEYNLFLMPMSFYPAAELTATATKLESREMLNLLEHLLEVEAQFPPDSEAPYAIALSIDTKFVRSSAADAVEVRWTDDKGAPAITMSEEDVIRRRYPIKYQELVDRCQKRYTNFKVNAEFYRIKKTLEDSGKHGDRFCRIHHFDVLEKKDPGRKYYSPEIFKELDKHYARL